MKKFWLFATLWLATLALAGCNCNCDCENTNNEDEVLNQRIAFCNEHWGTHSLIHSPTAVYGECAFPSGVTCEDTALESGECNYEPNLESIDTEEKRLAGCEENAQDWMTDFVKDAENVSIEWGEESEGGASFVRNGVAKYTRDGVNYTMDAECVADFVDGSISVNYGDEVAKGEAVANEENTEEATEEVVDEAVEAE